MSAEQRFLSRHVGKYAVKQANIVVVPYRRINGQRVRLPFDTADQAMAWAEKNYRDNRNWKVFQIEAPAVSNGE